ncbi:hypothetical protein POM88_028267 [Heracleum sosnowskyi]|uniref:Endonuclease/exonuclease/phosphatase domain-containing protein n=1 Tax=Heracleum sosnowskyi TaxID=360622 RepID=A0AAD8IBS4_9APIA|nr:hypothetical protein POM88_028267 [Heracleum sosnowskyi]
MSLISWNCHGLGTPWAFQFLKEITLQKRPDFIFLCEIISKTDTVERFQRAIGFEGVLVVESQGRSGGLALLWRHKDEVLLRSYSKNHIDAVVHMKDNNIFRLTGIYDMNLLGYPYTWERGAGTDNWIEVRLDRALSSAGFLNMFKDVTLTNLEVSTSDHTPLFLEFYKVKQAEDVFRSLAIPLSKLVGLKTVEMAEEGRTSRFFMTSDARTQSRWGENGRTDSPAGSPSATDKVHQTHKFEVSTKLDELNLS